VTILIGRLIVTWFIVRISIPLSLYHE